MIRRDDIGLGCSGVVYMGKSFGKHRIAEHKIGVRKVAWLAFTCIVGFGMVGFDGSRKQANDHNEELPVWSLHGTGGHAFSSLSTATWAHGVSLNQDISMSLL